MTATAPTSNTSPLASAQSLRQRHGRLSPLRLGIYCLASLGGHLLLMGLFRWAWQVQLATQPVGSPIGIDFVEVDLSDGSFAGQLPDQSDAASIAGGKLTAAQLNDLIAKGETAPTETAEPGQSKRLADSSPITETSQAADAAASSSQTSSEAADRPRAWFPFGQTGGQSSENSEGGLFGDRPSPTAPVEAEGETSTANNTSAPTRPNAVEGSSGTSGSTTDASATGNPGNPASPDSDLSHSNPSATAETSASTRPDATDASEPTNSNDALTGTAGESTTGQASNEGNNSSSDGNGSSSERPGRPNDLPPNMSDQPVSSNQTVPPDEATPGAGESNGSQPGANDAGPNDGPPNDGPPNNGNQTEATGAASASGGTSDSSSETEGSNPAGDSPGQADNAGGSTAGSNPGEASGSGETSDSEASAGGESEVPPRLGANLVVDEIQSRALNTQDVFTRLPRPLGDPLSEGSQSVNSGQCATQLAGLTPASYGQPVQLQLAVDVSGEVFYVEGVGSQAQTPVGQAIACIAKAWPFEPAQRVIDEGGVEKIEEAGAVLFVTVTISLLE